MPCPSSPFITHRLPAIDVMESELEHLTYNYRVSSSSHILTPPWLMITLFFFLNNNNVIRTAHLKFASDKEQFRSTKRKKTEKSTPI